jgi:DnaJ family protein C protein 22
MYVMDPKSGSMQKSLFVAYVCWLFGGLFGLHHFYLRRDVHAFLTWATIGGYFGLGWLRDAYKLPEYVRDVNEEPNYMRALIDRMRTESSPRNSWPRGIGTVIVANALGYLTIAALPSDYLLHDPSLFWKIKLIVVPLAIAIGTSPFLVLLVISLVEP